MYLLTTLAHQPSHLKTASKRHHHAGALLRTSTIVAKPWQPSQHMQQDTAKSPSRSTTRPRLADHVHKMRNNKNRTFAGLQTLSLLRWILYAVHDVLKNRVRSGTGRSNWHSSIYVSKLGSGRRNLVPRDFVTSQGVQINMSYQLL